MGNPAFEDSYRLVQTGSGCATIDYWSAYGKFIYSLISLSDIMISFEYL